MKSFILFRHAEFISASIDFSHKAMKRIQGDALKEGEADI